MGTATVPTNREFNGQEDHEARLEWRVSDSCLGKPSNKSLRRAILPNPKHTYLADVSKGTFPGSNSLWGFLTIFPFQSFHDIDLLQVLQSVIFF